jgi:large repetitive protein
MPTVSPPERAPRSGSPRRWGALVGLVGVVGLLLAGAAGATPATPARSVPIAAAITVPAPTTNTSAIDLGMALNASVDVSGIHGGSGDPANWAYTWLGLPTNCTSTDTLNYTCVPTATGAFSVSVRVNDSVSGTSGTSATVSITVNPDPTLTALTASPTTVGVNDSLTITAVATGGTGPLEYVYAGLPSGCSGNTSTITCRPTVAQVYNVSVYVVDSLGVASAAPANVTVTVSTGGASTSATAGPTALQWGIIAAILVVGLGVSVALFARARTEERRAYAGRPPARGPGGPRPPTP